MKTRPSLLGLLVPAVLVAALSSSAWAQPEDTLEDETEESRAETEEAGAETREVDEAPDTPVSMSDEMEQRVREAESRLDEVETASLLQRIRWSGDYRTVLATYQFEGPGPDGVVVDEANKEQWLHRLRLDARAQPLENLRFTGRLVMFKRYGTNLATAFPQDSAETRIPRDNALRLERAWLDWFITPKLALSVGRISYSNGPPAQLKENLTSSDATWGLQMVDGEFETFDMTYQVNPNVLIRSFYASWAFPRGDDLFSESLFLDEGVDNLRIIGGNIDVKSPSQGDYFVQLGAYAVPQFRPFTLPIPDPTAVVPPGSPPPPFNGGFLFPSAKPNSLGSYVNVSALALLQDIGGRGLDVFGSVAVGFLAPNGQGISYPLGPDGANVPVLGLASASPDEETTNTNLFAYAGFRFQLPIEAAKFPRVGFEYNYGSRYWISFASPTTDLANKLANRGHSYEGYWIQPINDYLFARFDVLHIDTDFSGGFFGGLAPGTNGESTSPEVDRSLTVYSVLLDAQF